MSSYELASIIVASIGLSSTFIAIAVFRHQIHQEKIAQAVKMAEIDQLKKSLDHAHDKIRNLDDKHSENSEVIVRIQTTLDENTRVLRKLEEVLISLAKIEQRLESHIQDDK